MSISVRRSCQTRLRWVSSPDLKQCRRRPAEWSKVGARLKITADPISDWREEGARCVDCPVEARVF